jgi:hypothetical protein
MITGILYAFIVLCLIGCALVDDDGTGVLRGFVEALLFGALGLALYLWM